MVRTQAHAAFADAELFASDEHIEYGSRERAAGVLDDLVSAAAPMFRIGESEARGRAPRTVASSCRDYSF
jgi:hypothetical protein